MRDETSEQSDEPICWDAAFASRVSGATASARGLQVAENGSQKEEAPTGITLAL